MSNNIKLVSKGLRINERIPLEGAEIMGRLISQYFDDMRMIKKDIGRDRTYWSAAVLEWEVLATCDPRSSGFRYQVSEQIPSARRSEPMKKGPVQKMYSTNSLLEGAGREPLDSYWPFLGAERKPRHVD